ncbi:MAG TPA: HAD-IA family hydrolase [Caulobacteraceae bacterium]|nr:HAD-IA family hydrolase [Caulobacteraceae bacterium]
MTALAGATIAFDLDGTLVDTAPDLVSALNQVLDEQGLAPLPLEAARVMVGRGAKHLIEQGYAATGLPLSPDLSPVLFERFIALYRAHIADQSRPFPGVVEALVTLRRAGAELVVCTNKRTDLSIALLDELDLSKHFTAVVGADAAPAAKPDARHLLFAISEVGGNAEHAVMVGDSITDLMAARNAGVPVVITSFGYTDIPASDLGGDLLLDHFDQLPAAALRLLAKERA